MHPQSELENYKLQVELLQEKLHRSEDNRQQLEGKLEHIMKKRNEHEKTLRSRSHRKYQQFLDEQKKRNERNRKLVDMLEQIDQQAVALSARSERLKMMKLQYELYFSKIVQSYSMKTLQNIPTIPLIPIQRQPNAYTMHKTDDVVSASYNNNSPQFQTVPIPMVVPIPNEQNRFHRSWAFATAPPGVLITLANNSTFPSTDIGNNSKNDSNLSFDYSQFPIGYLQNPTATTPIQCNVGQPYLQQTQQSKPMENNPKPLLTPDENVKQHLKFRDQIPTSFSFADSETNETILNKATQDLSQKIFELHMDKPMKNDEFGISEDKGNTAERKIVHTDKKSGFCQSLNVDNLSKINPNNSLQHDTDDGRVVSRGNKPNTIEFRTDDDDYIKYIKEMKETYKKGDSIPLNMTPQEHTIDNITTTLQIQKIDEINVKDDEKINDVEDNEKNTSSAFPPLGGKYSIEKNGDEALTRTPLENHPEENTTNTLARSIHPSRDTEQITLFNGTKNSKDERTGASNRTAAIIDGGSKNTSSENVSIRDRRLETSYRPMHFDKKEKMSIENIETAIYGELLTKSENLPPSDLLDQPKSETAGNAIKGTSQESNQLNDISNDVHEFQQDPVNHQQSDSYQVEQNQDAAQNEVVETTSSDYNYNDINNDVQGQDPEYDMQNYNYLNLPQEYKETSEEVPQQEYQYTGEEQKPQGENYVTDYQNYDTSQYQSEYDPNTYQYDYEQQQYDDPNQTKYTPEMYNQEYQQDPYSAEYSNYEQKASYEVDPSNQQFTEQQYMSTVEEQNPLEQMEQMEQIEQIEEIEQIESVEPVEPVEPIKAVEQNVPSEQEVIDAQVDTAKQNYSNSSEHTPNEDVVNQKAIVPTSILSTEKHTDLATKKKKRVNFVDSESDESSILPKPETVSSESDFDFSATQ